MKLDERTYYHVYANVFIYDPSRSVPTPIAVCQTDVDAAHIARALNELTERTKATREECGQ